MQVEGNVAPGFESMKALFEKEMHAKDEESAQLCVYHKGQKVVDLWASKTGNTEFTADNIMNIFSSGKSLESLALASLVDKGLLNYNDHIIKYWPEFTGKGKDEVTVADLMRHEAGLMDLRQTLTPEDLLTENIKKNHVGRIIEQAPSRRSKNTNRRREYHAVSRGWVANELFRRIDPEGRTIGEYLKEDITGPLNADVYIGVPTEKLNQLTKVRAPSVILQILESCKPAQINRKVENSIGLTLALVGGLGSHIIKSKLSKKKNSNNKKTNVNTEKTRSSNTKKGFVEPVTGLNPVKYREKTTNLLNQKEIIIGESPSFNANCSARGLAKVAAMLSAKGSFEGKEYFSESAWQACHGETKNSSLGGVTATRFSQGGLCLFELEGSKQCADMALNGGREGFFGWAGLGGSLFQWHPEEEIGFAFVPSSLHIMDFFNLRGKLYQIELMRCIKKLA